MANNEQVTSTSQPQPAANFTGLSTLITRLMPRSCGATARHHYRLIDASPCRQCGRVLGSVREHPRAHAVPWSCRATSPRGRKPHAALLRQALAIHHDSARASIPNRGARWLEKHLGGGLGRKREAGGRSRRKQQEAIEVEVWKGSKSKESCGGERRIAVEGCSQRKVRSDGPTVGALNAESPK